MDEPATEFPWYTQIPSVRFRARHFVPLAGLFFHVADNNLHYNMYEGYQTGRKLAFGVYQLLVTGAPLIYLAISANR